MVDKPVSPFAGLDKALLRSTQTAATTDENRNEPMPETRPPARQRTQERLPSRESRTDARVRAHTHTRTDAPTDGLEQIAVVPALARKLQAKQRLASSTFRFRPEELEELDRVFGEVKGENTQTVSKNDVVRLGLNWLLEDYRRNGEESVLVQVLARG